MRFLKFLIFVLQATSPTGDVVSVQYSGLACEGTELVLSCTAGFRIRINSAFFGRNDSTTCPPKQGSSEVTSRCQVRLAKEMLSSRCDDKQHCLAPSSVGFYGEPYPCSQLTFKYLRVTYSCEVQIYRALQCDDSGRLPLTCPNESLIRVQNASYVGSDSRTCSQVVEQLPSNISSCKSNTSSQVFRSLCDGRRQCDVEPSVTLFGNPCPHTTKQLQLSYACLDCRNDFPDDAKCDYYAITGQCESNPEWMLPNCRKSCWKCNRKMPVCENLENDTECAKWKAEGECITNPSWMSIYCRRSCLDCHSYTNCENIEKDEICEALEHGGKCRTEQLWMFHNCRKSCFFCTDPEVECKNSWHNDIECEKWELEGECDRNPGFMIGQCFRSCSKCRGKPECSNQASDGDCEAWVARGDCSDNASWMHKNCWQSCTGCKKIPATKCYNKHGNDSECRRWFLLNQCSENQEWMLQFCRATCFLCDGATASSQPRALTNIRCNDAGNHLINCSKLAQEGACDRNPGTMMTHCLQTCTGCQQEPKCENRYGSDDHCTEWLKDGQCRSNANWMHSNCWAACVGCSGENDICQNKHRNDVECEHWARLGSCYTNSYFMMKKCYMTCTRCAHTADSKDMPPNCINLNGDEPCEKFAEAGECHRNAEWMIPNCWKACTSCENRQIRMVGNLVRPGGTLSLTLGKTFLVGKAFGMHARLTHFAAYFCNNNPVQLQIWRENRNRKLLFYSINIKPRASPQAETIAVEKCVLLRPTDRLGFTSKSSVSPIAYNFEPSLMQEMIYFRDASMIIGFDRLALPYSFSLMAGYDQHQTC